MLVWHTARLVKEGGCVDLYLRYPLVLFGSEGSALTPPLFFFPRRGHSGIEGGRTRVTYFAEEGVFFKTSACPRFFKRRVLFCTQIRRMGVENPLTKYRRL